MLCYVAQAHVRKYERHAMKCEQEYHEHEDPKDADEEEMLDLTSGEPGRVKG